MYDYLAKIILLGPSGTGKYVHSPAHLDIGADPPPLPDPVSSTASSRVSGVSSRPRPSASNSPAKSSRSAPAREGNG